MNLPISERYDLKGATAGRYASRKELEKNHLAVRKDVDFLSKGHTLITRDSSSVEDFERILRCDISWLKSRGLIDYSLLVGFVTRADADQHTDHSLHVIHRLELANRDVITTDSSLNTITDISLSIDMSETRRSEDFQYAYVGIVDILMRYSWTKWLENLVLDRFISGISCQPPQKYGDRLYNYVKMLLGSAEESNEVSEAKKNARNAW